MNLSVKWERICGQKGLKRGVTLDRRSSNIYHPLDGSKGSIEQKSLPGPSVISRPKRVCRNAGTLSREKSEKRGFEF